MIISLIFVVVSLSTIDADRYLPPLKTKQLKGLDTGMNVILSHTQLQFCNKLWNNVKVLPGSAQRTFLKLMGTVVNVEETFQNIGQSSLVHRVKRLTKNKIHKEEDSKISTPFINLCTSMWDKVDEFTPSSQARIRTKLLEILEGAKHNLENIEPTYPEQTPRSVDNETEYTDGEIPQLEATPKESYINNNNNEMIEYIMLE